MFHQEGALRHHDAKLFFIIDLRVIAAKAAYFAGCAINTKKRFATFYATPFFLAPSRMQINHEVEIS
jgi:hypothetical protein